MRRLMSSKLLRAGAVATLVIMLLDMVAPAFAQNLTIVDPWAVFLNKPSGTNAIHDITEFTDPADDDLKLVIAYGWEQGAPILFWDPATQLLTTSFTAPLNTYPVGPYWRSLTGVEIAVEGGQ